MRALKISLLVFILSITISAQWYQQNSGTTSYLQSVYFINKDTGWAVGSYGTIIKTTNAGFTWLYQDSITYGGLYDIKFIDAQTGIIVGGLYVNGHTESVIFKTTDSGMNWISKTSGTGHYLNAISFSDINNATIVGEWATIRRTTDGGETWSFQNAYASSNFNSTFCIDSLNGFIVGGFPQIPPFEAYTILKTVDAGATWDKYFYNKILTDIYFINSSTGFIVGEQGTILKTTNAGNYWETKRSSSEYLNLYSVVCTDSNTIWAVGAIGTILISINSGNSWDLISSGTIKDLRDIYFLDKYNGWIVGDDGIILHTTNGGVTFVEEESNQTKPHSFLLSQNYPNPFNPTTSMQYAISSRQFVTLKVYDLLGREIATLVSEEKPAGAYEVEFDGTALPSGIYFYQLKAGPFVETRKMVLMK